MNKNFLTTSTIKNAQIRNNCCLHYTRSDEFFWKYIPKYNGSITRKLSLTLKENNNHHYNFRIFILKKWLKVTSNSHWTHQTHTAKKPWETCTTVKYMNKNFLYCKRHKTHEIKIAAFTTSGVIMDFEAKFSQLWMDFFSFFKYNYV